MDAILRSKARPLDSFTLVFKLLTASGYSKLFNPKNRFTQTCHRIYRILVILFVTTYNVQHTYYIWQVRNEEGKFEEPLFLLIAQLILYTKVLTMYFSTARIDRLVDMMEDPSFGADDEQDEQYMMENKNDMRRILKISNIGMSCVCGLWIIEPIINRILNGTTDYPCYMPFSTETWPTYLLAILLDRGAILWNGYGHFNIDCFVVILYSQARVQLKMFRYHLENLFNDDDDEPKKKNGNFQYLDDVDQTMKTRFVQCVKRYEKIQWFTAEITDIFEKAITIQFLLSSMSTCLMVYKASSIDPSSVLFAFYVQCYLAIQFQNFIYCYYGGMLIHESSFVCNSAYLGGWVRLSARFRRQLLIAMARWTRPITPIVAGMIPLSLTTFMTITRSAYSLYTVLKSKNSTAKNI